MKNLRLIILLILIGLLIAPSAFAKSDNPLYIQSAEVYTKNVNQGIAGEVTVCSSSYGKTSFVLTVDNQTINTRYKRNLLALRSGCHTYDIKFNKKFSLVSNTGDKIKFSLRGIKNEGDADGYDSRETYTTIIEERDTSDSCEDIKGGDDLYDACVGEFITHAPTGVRVRVISYDGKRLDLLVTGLEWGGTKSIRLYTGREKEVVAGDGERTRLSITNVGHGETQDVNLLIESVESM